MRVAYLAAPLVAVVVAGCGDDVQNGRATAERIAGAITQACGTTEAREAGGPRTITPIDLDGSDGPTGYLVTCVNGRTSYVEAKK